MVALALAGAVHARRSQDGVGHAVDALGVDLPVGHHAHDEVDVALAGLGHVAGVQAGDLEVGVGVQGVVAAPARVPGAAPDGAQAGGAVAVGTDQAVAAVVVDPLQEGLVDAVLVVVLLLDQPLVGELPVGLLLGGLAQLDADVVEHAAVDFCMGSQEGLIALLIAADVPLIDHVGDLALQAVVEHPTDVVHGVAAVVLPVHLGDEHNPVGAGDVELRVVGLEGLADAEAPVRGHGALCGGIGNAAAPAQDDAGGRHPAAVGEQGLAVVLRSRDVAGDELAHGAEAHHVRALLRHHVVRGGQGVQGALVAHVGDVIHADGQVQGLARRGLDVGDDDVVGPGGEGAAVPLVSAAILPLGADLGGLVVGPAVVIIAIGAAVVVVFDAVLGRGHIGPRPDHATAAADAVGLLVVVIRRLVPDPAVVVDRAGPLLVDDVREHRGLVDAVVVVHDLGVVEDKHVLAGIAALHEGDLAVGGGQGLPPVVVGGALGNGVVAVLVPAHGPVQAVPPALRRPRLGDGDAGKQAQHKQRAQGKRDDPFHNHAPFRSFSGSRIT